MRQALLFLGIFCALVFPIATLPASAYAPKTEVFFNGKDLEGWEGLKEYWCVKDGMLVGATPDGLKFNTFLCSKKKFKDFELKFKVRCTGKGWEGNSGVQVRSELLNRKEFDVKGPQCDIGQKYWGSLYGEHFGDNNKGYMMKWADARLIAKVLKKDDFNDYYIKVVGKRVTIKLNGETTVDEEFEKLPAEGIIAWQLHKGQPMEAVFKDIEFKDLSAK